MKKNKDTYEKIMRQDFGLTSLGPLFSFAAFSIYLITSNQAALFFSLFVGLLFMAVFLFELVFLLLKCGPSIVIEMDVNIIQTGITAICIFLPFIAITLELLSK